MFAFICIFACSQAFAQADIGLKGAGLKIGIVGPQDVDATVGFAAFADLGQITPNIMMETYIDYWQQSENLFTGGEATIRDITWGTRAKWMFPVSNPKIKPFAGAGLGVHFLNAKVDVPAQFIGPILMPAFTLEDSSTKVGLDIGGGVAATINDRTDFIGELWYGFVSDVNQLALNVGFLYKL
jgi:hypothetical protein